MSSLKESFFGKMCYGIVHRLNSVPSKSVVNVRVHTVSEASGQPNYKVVSH